MKDLLFYRTVVSIGLLLVVALIALFAVRRELR
jgi:hypothetical protein